MLLPAGQELTPEGVLARVEGGQNPEGVLYRRRDGRVYFLGNRADRLLWRNQGYQFVDSIAFVRDRVESARKHGVRERSIAWYLLTDAERWPRQ